VAMSLSLHSTDGTDVSSLYGTLLSLSSWEKMFTSNDFYLCFDFGRNPERLSLYPNYKKREKDGDYDETVLKRIYSQVRMCEDVLNELKFLVFKFPDTEADDIISTLSFMFSSEQCVIISTDGDFLQLISPNIDVYHPIKKELYTFENFEEKLGLKLEDFVLYRSLVGDTSDNIPGVSGIGPARAKKVIASRVNGKFIENSTWTNRVRENLEIVERNMKLIKLGYHTDIGSKIREILRQERTISLREASRVLERYQISSIDITKFYT